MLPTFPILTRTLMPAAAAALLLGLAACGGAPTSETATVNESDAGPSGTPSRGEALVERYVSFTLDADLSGLSDNQRQIVGLLIEASDAMDGVFWQQAYGDRDALLASIDDPALRRYAEINYGPWDRLDDNLPFIDGVGAKPLGAQFYPADADRAEIERAAEADEAILSLYTMVRRAEDGSLVAESYHQAFAEAHQLAAGKLREAAALAEDAGLKRYLELRAEALLTDDYLASDMAWMDMRTNLIDVIIGPIETYEDKLFGAKAAHEGYVVIKDMDWSARLARYADLLPGLQRDLPVDAAYKQESPGGDADLGAYEVVYYAGDCNAGAKTIAVNLPNDERVQLEKGARRLQLKNAMQAKFDKILVPISEILITPDQRQHVQFDAFFSNTMFHEIAHGLGIKNTITDRGTVREALSDHASAIEEGKADVLGLFMVTQLHQQGELGDADLMDNYVTFVASIFRSIRFGTASAHGMANLIRFNYFQEKGAFVHNPEDGTYAIDFDAMEAAVKDLSARILVLQGDGDYDVVAAFVGQYGVEGEALATDLQRVNDAGIPVDVVFEQGPQVLGLTP
ncbi:MAG: Zn-dependent hydrolase [Acidobacteriota bacterium]